jgi:hypothetical protein
MATFGYYTGNYTTAASTTAYFPNQFQSAFYRRPETDEQWLDRRVRELLIPL